MSHIHISMEHNTSKKPKRYETWQAASAVAILLGIEKYGEYGEKYKNDPEKRMPSNPSVVYSDFPGWIVFLGNQKVHRGGRRGNFYSTWQEAVSAASSLRIETGEDYVRLYHADIRLHSNPYICYSDFPGFPISKALKAVKKKKKQAA